MPRVQIPHLETNVTIACQRRCVACNHFVPLQVGRVKQSMISVEQLRDDLINFTRIAHTDAWAAIGGEPLLHPNLEYLLMTARSVLPTDTKIEVWTNGEALKGGKRPEVYDWQLDRLVVSAYPGVLEDADIVEIERRGFDSQIEVLVKDERHHPNFTQLLVARDQNRVITQKRYDACWFKTYSRVLDNGYFYRCCTSPFIPQLIQDRPEGIDGLRITAETTSHDLQAFLDQQVAPISCESCAGRNTPEAYPIPWGEEKDPERWRKLSGGGQ